MDVFKVVKRRPIVFPLAMVAAVAMVLISEAAYWRSVRTLNEMTINANARSTIQGLRQGILSAQTAQRSYLLTERREYLVTYNKAVQETAASFEFLEQRYRSIPAHRAVLTELDQVTDALLTQLAVGIQQHDTGQRIVLEGSDDVQVESIRTLSAQLLDVETVKTSANQNDIYQTLMLSRIGVALLSAISLLALVMYLRQSFALERQLQAVQDIVQAERDRLEIEVRQRTAQLTELTHHLQTAREDERSRLARNLHDDLGALLTAAKLDAARIRSRLISAGSATKLWIYWPIWCPP